jgi:uncharacterized protein
MNQYSTLINATVKHFQLELTGIHGVSHWARVAYNGVILSRLTPGVDVHVTQLFAFIHDSCRLSDDGDPDHGPRAAQWAISNCNVHFVASSAQLDMLVQACIGHTSELHHLNPTVQACWDADRLDIGRCKANIDPKYLGLAASKLPGVLVNALARSRGL